jgi:hypothetical protein
MENNRRAVLVLGMHRSGTSAMARVANLLGAALPEHLLPLASDNPTGHWESRHVSGVNEWMLASVNASWRDCLRFAPDHLSGPDLPATMGVLLDIVRSAFGQHEIFVMKDPRLSLLLDFWLPTLDCLRIDAHAVVMLRHPVEVARSLVQRDRMSLQAATALWLRYALDAERGTRAVRRSIVGYDDLIADWRHEIDRVTGELGICWPRQPAIAAPEVGQFLRPELRHHDASRAGVEVIPALLRHWVVETYSVLRQLTRTSAASQQLRILDRVRDEFTRWCGNRLGPATPPPTG